MTLHSSIQALIWKCWRRSHLQFVLVTAAVLMLLTVLIGMDLIPPELETRNRAVRAFIHAGLFILWSACPGLTYNLRNGLNGTGFIFPNEYTRPVSTALLTFVPLLYICLLAIVAYLIPAVFVWQIFDLAPPNSPMLFLVIEVTLLFCAIQWLSASNIAVWINWTAMLLLLWLGWLLPGPITFDENGAIAALPLSAFIPPGLIVLVVLTQLHFSVRSQRRGEKIFAAGGGNAMPLLHKFRLSDFLTFLQRPCPTQSAAKATWWREQQLHGPANLTLFAVLQALAGLITISLLDRLGDTEAGVPAIAIVGIISVWYAIICFFTPLQIFDLNFTEKDTRISPFSRTRPIGTATLAAIKIAVLISGLLYSALIMALTTAVAGPLFIVDFNPVMTELFTTISTSWQYSWLESAVLGLLLLVFFSSIISIYGAAIVWMVLGSIKLIFLISIPVYGLSLFIFLTMITPPPALEARVAYVFAQHLWLLLIVAAVAASHFLITLWQDHVLDRTQLFSILAVTGILWVLFLIYMGPDSADIAEQELVFAVAAFMQGLLPLFAIVFVLWTLNRIRHN